MKAPNGNPTNLTEKQWLQVRTKAFKNWFGDWESLAESHVNTLEILNEDGSINFDKLEELSDEYFKNADESLFNKGRKTLRERQEHHKGESNTLEHIQNVVKSAQQSNVSDNLKQHVVIAAALHDLAKPFHGGNKHGFQSEELLNKIFKGKVSGLARFAIANHMMTIEEGQEFTREDAERIVNDAIKRNLDVNEAIDVLIALHIADITRGRNLEDIDEYSNKSVRDVINNEVENKRQLLKEVANTKENNNVSKVVDENGEPLVVYHHDSANLTDFGKRQISDWTYPGIYFSRDPRGEYGKYQTAAFISIKNPFEAPAYITADNLDGQDSLYDEVSKEHDGAIGYYEDEEGNLIRSAKSIHEYVVFNPNQIKSATGNTGAFSTENDNIQYFATPQGEVFGFVDKEGNIYLDETVISPEHPIHEYTHLWDRIVAKNNPKLWKRGVELMKQTSLWKEIEDDPNYGQRWKAIKGISDEKVDNLIASEVHARFSGEGGSQLIEKLAKEKGQKGIINKVKDWILEVWKDLRQTFAPWSDIELASLTLKDFNHMPLRDFVSGISLAKAMSGRKNTGIGTKENPIQIYSDGSDIKGTGQIGYGAVFMHEGNAYGLSGTEASAEVTNLKEQFPDAKFSNPTMEMLALTTTLEHFANSGIGEHIEINQDYKGAVNFGELWKYSEGSEQREAKAWKPKEAYIAHLVDRAAAAINQIEKNGGSVKIKWVKGHQKVGTEQAKMNDLADSYAKSRDEYNNISDAYNTGTE